MGLILLKKDDVKYVNTRVELVSELSNSLIAIERIKDIPVNIRHAQEIGLCGVMLGIDLLTLFRDDIEMTYSQIEFLIDKCFFSIENEKMYIDGNDYSGFWYNIDNEKKIAFDDKVTKISGMYLQYLDKIKEAIYNDYVIVMKGKGG